MALNISAWSIRQPVAAIVLFLMLCVVGIASFERLPITRFPNVDVPIVRITIIQSGAAPAELETHVTREVEDAVANLKGVKHISSFVTDGQSTTAIEFRLGTDPDDALAEARDAIDKLQASLPADINEPVVEKIDVQSQSVQTFAASAPAMTLEQLSWYVDDVVIPRLKGIPGVGRVERFGGVDREVSVLLRPDRLMALGITAGEVSRQLKANNVDLAGGRGKIGGQEQTIRTLAGSRTIEDLGDTTIVLSDGREAQLSDLGIVKDSFAEPTTFARLDGTTPVVSFAIFCVNGASAVDVARNVTAALGALRDDGSDVDYALIDDKTEYDYANYRAGIGTLFEGAFLACFVVFVFLRDWRATIIVATALPLSIIPTFWVMEMLGFSFNFLTLLAMTLVSGILVDDAIVEIENIVRHMKMGKSPYRAALEAADEIGLAVIAISLTIVAVFSPVSFIGGIAGQFFKEFGLTVAIAVLFSLLVARLVTPMLAAYFTRPHRDTGEPIDGPVMRFYTGLLAVTIRHRYLTLAAGIGLFATSMAAMATLPEGFIPPVDTNRVVISAELPPGSDLDQVLATTDAIVAEMRQMPEVERVYVLGGTSPSDGAVTVAQNEHRRASIYVRLVSKEKRRAYQKEIESEITTRLRSVPDLRASYVNDRGGREFNLAITGDDPVVLQRAADEIESAMRQLPGFFNVAVAGGTLRPELEVRPRLREAARFGITTQQISEAIRVATIGDVDSVLPKFNADERLIPIRVQLDVVAREDLSLLRAMPVRGATGQSAPLEAVADVELGLGVSSIERLDRKRRLLVGADLARAVPLGAAMEQVKALPVVQNLPDGVHLVPYGDAEVMDEVFDGFALSMVIGLIIMLGLLVLLFGNGFQPITILLSLPLSMGGVVAGLVLTQNPVSMPVVIGILMLMGIVTKNSIMLVDFAIMSMKAGMARNAAVVEAGRKRARPVIMTTIAMVAGMAPSALALGEGGEFRAPMAIAVIGGLVVSTLLSLVFVPSFFTVMEDLSAAFHRRFGGLVGPRDEPPVAVPAAAPPSEPPRLEARGFSRAAE